MDLPKSDKSQNEQDELRRLHEENDLLKALLTRHGITWEEPIFTAPIPVKIESSPAQTHFTTDDKIALFRRLFRGWEDVYPQRWESVYAWMGWSRQRD
jgi:hypothetical protein